MMKFSCFAIACLLFFSCDIHYAKGAGEGDQPNQCGVTVTSELLSHPALWSAYSLPYRLLLGLQERRGWPDRALEVEQSVSVSAERVSPGRYTVHALTIRPDDIRDLGTRLLAPEPVVDLMATLRSQRYMFYIGVSIEAKGTQHTNPGTPAEDITPTAGATVNSVLTVPISYRFYAEPTARKTVLFEVPAAVFHRSESFADAGFNSSSAPVRAQGRVLAVKWSVDVPVSLASPAARASPVSGGAEEALDWRAVSRLQEIGAGLTVGAVNVHVYTAQDSISINRGVTRLKRLLERHGLSRPNEWRAAAGKLLVRVTWDMQPHKYGLAKRLLRYMPDENQNPLSLLQLDFGVTDHDVPVMDVKQQLLELATLASEASAACLNSEYFPSVSKDGISFVHIQLGVASRGDAGHVQPSFNVYFRGPAVRRSLHELLTAEPSAAVSATNHRPEL